MERFRWGKETNEIYMDFPSRLVYQANFAEKNRRKGRENEPNYPATKIDK
jgi:hypothetical protein